MICSLKYYAIQFRSWWWHIYGSLAFFFFIASWLLSTSLYTNSREWKSLWRSIICLLPKIVEWELEKMKGMMMTLRSFWGRGRRNSLLQPESGITWLTGSCNIQDLFSNPATWISQDWDHVDGGMNDLVIEPENSHAHTETLIVIQVITIPQGMTCMGEVDSSPFCALYVLPRDYRTLFIDHSVVNTCTKIVGCG